MGFGREGSAFGPCVFIPANLPRKTRLSSWSTRHVRANLLKAERAVDLNDCSLQSSVPDLPEMISYVACKMLWLCCDQIMNRSLCEYFVYYIGATDGLRQTSAESSQEGDMEGKTRRGACFLYVAWSIYQTPYVEDVWLAESYCSAWILGFVGGAQKNNFADRIGLLSMTCRSIDISL